ncbi:VOC family protein [Jiella sonneratiae]|uniref:VOC family protein n=1 Tax=Jiella sonneratiae TaxID=2816856 RepID=A0ABS3J3K3_9HYPH|nr:VOC family protein [Jiella sonneratiae]
MSDRAIARLALLVEDYDAAIAWFCRCLGFVLLEDTPLTGEKRWVRLAPPGGRGAELLLARAAGDAQRGQVGGQGGGRVFLYLETDDFAGDHARMTAAGVRFLEEPRVETYGTVAVFEDLCGNRWDLVEPA